VKVEGRAVDWSLIDFEIAGVDDYAYRRADGEGYAVYGAVGDRDKFDFEGADFQRGGRPGGLRESVVESRSLLPEGAFLLTRE